MSKRKKKNFYAIKVGHKSNVVVSSWIECQSLIEHYPNAIFKGFYTKEEAEQYLVEKTVIEKSENTNKSDLSKSKPKLAGKKRSTPKKGYRIEVYLSDPQIYKDMLAECKRLDLTIDKAIEGLIREWIYFEDDT